MHTGPPGVIWNRVWPGLVDGSPVRVTGAGMTRIHEVREQADRARRKAAEAESPGSKDRYLLIAATFDKVADDLEYLDHLRGKKPRLMQ